MIKSSMTWLSSSLVLRVVIPAGYLITGLILPADAFAQYFQQTPFDRYAPPTSVGNIFGIATGAFGGFTMLAFAFMALITYAIGRSINRPEQQRKGMFFLGIAAAFYFSRILIRYFYFRDVPAVTYSVDQALDVGLSIILGGTLIGLPSFVFGAYAGRGVRTLLSHSVPELLSATPSSEMQISPHVAVMMWMILCGALLAFGWYAYLGAFACLSIGILSATRLWEESADETESELPNSLAQKSFLGTLLIALFMSVVLGLLVTDCLYV